MEEIAADMNMATKDDARMTAETSVKNIRRMQANGFKHALLKELLNAEPQRQPSINGRTQAGVEGDGGPGVVRMKSIARWKSQIRSGIAGRHAR